FLPILVLMLVGLGTHALLSYVGDGFSAPRSNPWYIAVVFPATALLIHGGTAWLPRRLHLSLGVLAAVFLFAAEVWGHAWVITRVSCAGADPQTTWRRLARLTPDFLGPGLAAPLLGLAVVLFALVLGRALAAAGLAVAPDVPAPGTIPGRPAAS
ncbi:MAG: hypothetical protein H6807_17165, partial [Planctomycetes bacterium]|nr:hypothetical protein [Planctomycetota bacterium]